MQTHKVALCKRDTESLFPLCNNKLLGLFKEASSRVCLFCTANPGPVESAEPFIWLESVLPVVALAPGSSGALIAKTSIINDKLFL